MTEMIASITEQFEELGIEPSNEILDKCVELCLTHNITDAVEFVEQWMAFSITNYNGAEPSLSYLLEFERKELAATKKETHNTPSIKKGQFNRTKNVQDFNASNNMDFDDIDPIALYGKVKIDSANSSNSTAVKQNFDIEINDEILDNYGCKTPKAIKNAAPKTPASLRHDVKFSPASYSPVCGTPKSITGNSGKIVYTFGHSSLVKEISWSAKEAIKINVKNILTYENEPLTQKAKYLFDNLLDKINFAADLIFERGKEICKKHFGPDTIDYDLHHPDIMNTETFKTIGTVFCEHDAQLDRNSVILVGSDDMKLRSIHLNFDKSKPFGIFPGQTIMVSGTNHGNGSLMVEEIFTERNLKLPTIPKLDQTINFVIAAGPFTHSDDLVYDPLSDLIAYLKKEKPHVLILLGPLVDTEHSMINGNVIAETFESYYLKIISGIIEDIGSETTICVVSSNRDANADMVYPTPPINLGKLIPNVHMLPDPCIIDVNGIEIGLTATDVFEHILNKELILGAGDKVKRITNYLFHQNSFYPLNPPMDGLCYDSELASKYSKIDKIPNIIVLPSNNNIFLRDVNGCLSVNPGRLASKTGGTFARLAVCPLESEKQKPLLLDYMACQIMKV